jgi:hypothetical protein
MDATSANSEALRSTYEWNEISFVRVKPPLNAGRRPARKGSAGGDHTDALPTAHGFQEYWGYLYHLDAMQGVSFPDINKTPTLQTVAPVCMNTPIPGIPEVPGAVDPKTTPCLTPPRNVLWCKSSDGSSQNQMCQDQGPLTLPLNGRKRWTRRFPPR